MDSRDRGKLVRAGFRIYRRRLAPLSCHDRRRRYLIWVLDGDGNWRKHMDNLNLEAVGREWEFLMADERNIGDH